MGKMLKIQINAYLLLLTFTSSAYASLPGLTIDGVDTEGNDPVKMATEIGGAVFSAGMTFVVGFFALSIMRNGWSKYHETGEDGSRTQLKDAAINMGIGAVLLVAAIAIAQWGLTTFG